MEEIWKDIPGYEGLYQVSDLGRVKSFFRSGLIRKVAYKKGRSKDGTILLPYPYLPLCKNGIHKTHFVHKLVMLAFVGTMPENCNVIMHLNDNPKDCKLVNLKYGTQKENVRDCYDKGRGYVDLERLKINSQKGANARKRRIIAMKDGIEQEFEGIRPAAKILGLLNGSIAHVLSGRKSICKGYKFKYA